MKLTKTDYLIYRNCPHNAWVKLHRPHIYRAQPPSAFDLSLLEIGNEVDRLARELFPDGALITRGDAETTTRLVHARQGVLYQPVFETAHLTTACDILVWNANTTSYDLFEVKASTSDAETKARDEEYLFDLGFQAEVLRQCDVPLGRLCLIRLDSSYIRGQNLDINALFAIDDLTESVTGLRDQISVQIDTAIELLTRSTPLPSPCSCIGKGRRAHCTTFAFTNPNVPDYSVHDISRIGASKRKLADLIERGIFDIRDVPDDFELRETQSNQVRAARTRQVSIDKPAIADFLSGLTFPLIFLDYETYPAAIPRFPGYGPFHHIPFQFSLDVLETPGTTLSHQEFLHTDTTCPDKSLIDALRRAMPATGSVITWNKSFEKGVNQKLAVRNPDARGFFSDLDDRVVDLMDVFTGQAFVHPEFRGRTSIKAILPVLVPKLSYKAVAIQDGATATAKWNDMVTSAMPKAEAEQIAADLLAYCALDTRAMVEIWRVLCSVAEAEDRVA